MLFIVMTALLVIFCITFKKIQSYDASTNFILAPKPEDYVSPGAMILQ
jgi:hypothetical protein